MSIHDTLMRKAGAPVLLGVNASRNEDGSFAPALYRSPGQQAAEPKQLTGAIWSQVQFQDLVDDSGGLMRRETRTCRVLRSETDAAGISGFEFEATIDDPSGESEAAWTLEETTTVWGEVFVTFGLVRIPLVRKGERRAAV